MKKEASSSPKKSINAAMKKPQDAKEILCM
jgi:hypothetical protein